MCNCPSTCRDGEAPARDELDELHETIADLYAALKAQQQRLEKLETRTDD